MPELNQLFLIDGIGRGAQELRDTLIRHRVFGVSVSAARDDLVKEVEAHGFHVTRCDTTAAFAKEVWDIRGSHALVVNDSETLAAVEQAALGRNLPIIRL